MCRTKILQGSLFSFQGNFYFISLQSMEIGEIGVHVLEHVEKMERKQKLDHVMGMDIY